MTIILVNSDITFLLQLALFTIRLSNGWQAFGEAILTQNSAGKRTEPVLVGSRQQASAFARASADKADSGQLKSAICNPQSQMV
jgi:hypothetical protein